jgi:hypothetical protein
LYDDGFSERGGVAEKVEVFVIGGGGEYKFKRIKNV